MNDSATQFVETSRQIAATVETTTGLPHSDQDRRRWAEAFLIMMDAIMSIPPSDIVSILDQYRESRKGLPFQDGDEGLILLRNAAVNAARTQRDHEALQSLT